MKRLFLAVDFLPNNDFFDFFVQLKSSMSKLDATNWVKPNLLHCTLKFLGATPEEKISPMCQMLNNEISQLEPICCTINHLGVFGSRYQPRILWLNLNGGDSLFCLHNLIEKRMKLFGFKPYFGNFVPHITLARIHQLNDKRMFWQAFELLKNKFSTTITIEQVVLYESILKNGFNPKYEKIETFSLKNI